MKALSVIPVLLGIAAASCSSGCEKEPELVDRVAKAITDKDIGKQVDQTINYECTGEDLAPGEEPEIDIALKVWDEKAKQAGKRVYLEFTLTEAHGWEVCVVNIDLWHNVFNEETQQWERDGEFVTKVTVPKIHRGPEPTVFKTLYSDGEIPYVVITEAGPPEAWGYRLGSWNVAKK
jgi:hypothetical protein